VTEAPTPGGDGLGLASLPVPTRLRWGGDGATGGGQLWRAVARSAMGSSMRPTCG
jgi:hypothetical protein